MKLTRREAQIAKLVGDGHANKEIAARLLLTEGTVKVYVSRIFQKLGCPSRLDLALRVRDGLLRIAVAEVNDRLGVHLAGAGCCEGAD